MTERKTLGGFGLINNIGNALGPMGSQLKANEISFVKAMDLVRQHLQENKHLIEDKEKTKEYRESIYRDIIAKFLLRQNLKINGYSSSGEAIEAILDELVGYGPLSDAMKDPNITDIYVVDYQTIYVETRQGEINPYLKTWESKQHYEQTIERLLRDDNKKKNSSDETIVDFTLGPHRGNVIDGVIAERDSTIAIRKHGQFFVDVNTLINQGVVNKEEAQFISTIIKGGCNVIVAGPTGSGKTTSMQAFLNEALIDKRVIVAEDTREIKLKNPHTVYLVSRKSKEESSSVTLRDLIIAMLRMKPQFIIVGEVRGEEALAAVEAMITGHPTYFTMHGGDPWEVITRLAEKYQIEIPSISSEAAKEIVARALDYVIIQKNIPGIGKRIINISEISFNFKSGQIIVRPIWKLDYNTYSPIQVNPINQDKAEKMYSNGIKKDELQLFMARPQNSDSEITR